MLAKELSELKESHIPKPAWLPHLALEGQSAASNSNDLGKRKEV